MALTEKTPLGPNLKKLLIERISQLQIERAKKEDPTASGLELAVIVACGMVHHIRADSRDAFEWLKTSLNAIRNARGGNALGDDEAIAGVILKGIEARRKGAS